MHVTESNYGTVVAGKAPLIFAIYIGRRFHHAKGECGTGMDMALSSQRWFICKGCDCTVLTSIVCANERIDKIEHIKPALPLD